MKLVIKYNGRRYPRTVSLGGGEKINFLDNRKELTLNEYDALLLLRSNSRLNPTKWEFNVVGVVSEKGDTTPVGATSENPQGPVDGQGGPSGAESKPKTRAEKKAADAAKKAAAKKGK